MLPCLWPTGGAAQARPGHSWLPGAGYWGPPAHRDVAHGGGRPMENPTQEKQAGPSVETFVAQGWDGGAEGLVA